MLNKTVVGNNIDFITITTDYKSKYFVNGILGLFERAQSKIIILKNIYMWGQSFPTILFHLALEKNLE